jgi:hypothetical protein
MNATNRLKGRLGRTATLGTTAAFVAVAALMFLAPLSAAATGAILVPKRSIGATTQLDVQLAGCGKAHVGKAPHYATKTGVFLFSGTASAVPCKRAPMGSSAFNVGDLSMSAPIKVKASGNYVINMTWRVTQTSSWNMTPFSSCTLNYAASYSICLVEAEVSVYAFTYLYDSNGSYFNFGGAGASFNPFNISYVENYSQNYNCAPTCTHGGGNYSYGGLTGTDKGTFVRSTVLNASGSYALTKGTTYTLEVIFEEFASAYAEVESATATGTPSAFASMNAGTGGNSAQLQTVTVT